MTENSAFSSSGLDAITQTLDLHGSEPPAPLSGADFETFYEIERTSGEIRRHGWKRVALQFPDELLHASVPVFRALKRRIDPEQQLYVLADTSYGSCCVDEVAASHVDAEAVVHYGRACLSRTSRLPVLYVFGHGEVDVDDCVAKLVDVLSSIAEDDDVSRPKIVLRSDVAYVYRMPDILEQLHALLPDHPISYTSLPITTLPSSSKMVPQATSDGSIIVPSTGEDDHARFSPDELESSPSEDHETILYVGAESPSLTHLLLTRSSSSIYTYDPSTKTTRLESARTNKLLQRRYYLLHAARDASVFGLLVGTLGVSAYLPLMAHLRALIKKAGRKSYTVCVGKLNPAKLGNFAEVQAWVLVACPEGSLVDSKEFPAPIVTPYELQLALAPEPEWTGRYVFDFGTLLAEGAEAPRAAEAKEKDDDNHDDEDRPHFSLVTGKFQYSKRPDSGLHEKKVLEPSTDVVLRNQDNALSTIGSAAADFLHERSWQGLDQRLGQDAPSMLEQGRSGIARGYGEDEQQP